MFSHRINRSIISIFFIAITVFGQKKESVIAGFVKDGNGLPLAMVNVQIVGTHDGDATNSKGRFVFKTGKRGEGIVRASRMGYEPVNFRLTVSENDSIVLNIEMNESSVKLKEVVVAGSAFTTGDEPKALTLRSLEVFTTPGAAADIFRAIQTFPGVVAVDEGSGLFVRGGFFGTIPPFLIGGTFFSSGGFSARYGNALSGVLAMESLNKPSKLTSSVGVRLAAGSLAASIPIIPNTLGIRISGNKSFTDAMFRMNGSRSRFTVPPEGLDGNVSVIWKYSPTAQIKFFNFVNTDLIGVRVDELSFKGVYKSQETNWFHNLQWSEATEQWLLKGSLSLNRFIT